MSDVQRVYRGPVRGRLSSTRRGRRRGGFPFKRLAFLLLLLLAGAAYWISRDTHPLHSLIPSQQKYSVVLRDILKNRAELAESAVWDTLPPESGSGKITQALRGELGLPEWMARNIIVDDCYISGNDLRDFSDVLCVTKMTRIGTLVEQLHWVTSRIRRDTAGGLGLRHVPNAGMFYAVRGRILLISPSRDALVNAHFAIPGVHMLRLREGGPGFVDPSQRIIHWKGQKIDLSAFAPAKQADYLWYFGRLPPASEMEEDMLDLAAGVRRTSRLSCQIVLTEDLDGLTVHIPSESRNMQGPR